MNFVEWARLGTYPFVAAAIAFVASWIAIHRLAEPGTQLSVFGVKYTKRKPAARKGRQRSEPGGPRAVKVDQLALWIALITFLILTALILAATVFGWPIYPFKKA